VSGGRLREHELLRRLADDVELHLCVVSKTYDEDRAAAGALGGVCASVTVFPAEPDASGPNGGAPLQVRRHVSAGATEHVRELVSSGWVDLVHVEGFYLVQHVPDPSPLPLLLAEQNVEYLLWRQRMDTARAARHRREHFLQYRTTREHELAAWRRSTMCAAVTEEDRAAMLRAAPELDVRVVPDGADHLRPAADSPSSDDRTILLVANFAYEPNEDAAVFFVREVLPAVRRRVPGARVLLVGNEPPPSVRALASENVAVTGRVPSIEPYLDRAAVAVCPLRIGGGIKVKVLEALCRGKALVSTSVGVQGLGREVGRCVAIADDAPAFAAAVAHLLERPPARRRLEAAAARFSRLLPRWDESANALADCYRDLLSVPASRAIEVT
jgi:glycosyltransferase involved in cell wall biosynthesis